MRRDIVFWIKEMKKKFGLEAVYIPDNDVYSLRFKGKSVHNFNSKNYYLLPKRYRENHVRALLKVGLNHNIGQNIVKQQIILNRCLGKRI